MSYVVLMSHMVTPEARVHASDLFISNDMGGSEVSSFALTVLAGIAEFERGLIHQRTRNFPQA